MPGLSITGADQLAAVGRQLSAAGNWTLRARLRRNVVTTTAPITSEAKAQWSDGYGRLGASLAAATRTRVISTGPRVSVSVLVDSAKMPAYQASLPPLVEGVRPWRHMRWGQPPWYPQDPRPELGPAVQRHLPGVQIGVIEAVEQTAQALARGSA